MLLLDSSTVQCSSSNQAQTDRPRVEVLRKEGGVAAKAAKAAGRADKVDDD